MKRHFFRASQSVVFGTLLAAATLGFSQDQSMPNMPMPSAPVASPPQEHASAQAGLGLAQLEQMALTNNPTLAQACPYRKLDPGKKR